LRGKLIRIRLLFWGVQTTHRWPAVELLVARSGYDQDRRYTLAARAADWAGNAKSVRRSSGLLAGLAVRQFWPFCAAQLNICGHLDVVRIGSILAIFLELEQGFGGVVRISPEPMRQAVKTLEAEPNAP
jgi:hypothetical protein